MAATGRLNAVAFGLGITLCLMHQSLMALAAMTMEETCAIYPGPYIADPSDCQGWGKCENNKLVATGKCGSGLLYDSLKAMCNYADQVECMFNATTMCTGLDAVYKADPDNCQRYCYCENGVTECAECPEYQSYDPVKDKCVWNSENNNCQANSPCRLVPSNTFVANPDPDKCGEWLLCVGGVGSGDKCSTSGYSFNPSTGYCEEGGMNCPTEPDFSTAIGKCTQSDTFIDDEVTCGGYIACTAVGEGTWNKCPLGTHFDKVKKMCVTPYTYACIYDRCDNLNLTFVTSVPSADPTDLTCKKYVVCSDQKEVDGPDECSAINPDYLYFDEYAQGCVKEKPVQTICGN